jgi:hypothetical protein
VLPQSVSRRGHLSGLAIHAFATACQICSPACADETDTLGHRGWLLHPFRHRRRRPDAVSRFRRIVAGNALLRKAGGDLRLVAAAAISAQARISQLKLERIGMRRNTGRMRERVHRYCSSRSQENAGISLKSQRARSTEFLRHRPYFCVSSLILYRSRDHMRRRKAGEQALHWHRAVRQGRVAAYDFLVARYANTSL